MKTKEKIEFGDFQTPLQLAKEVVSSLTIKENYKTIIEPTCGLGNFLYACIQEGVDPSKIQGWEINPVYVDHGNNHLNKLTGSQRIFIEQKNFFEINWETLKASVQEPILFLGNPPWVTNSELGKLLSKNIPKKLNFQGLTGLDAMTGKSNFDISESMLITLLDFISGTNSSLAFLIKTSVARKLFKYIGKTKLRLSSIAIRLINAKKQFNVNVDACLFTAAGCNNQPINYKCDVYSSINEQRVKNTMGFSVGISDGHLVSDLNSYQKLSHIDIGCEFKWRSGVKHDASKVMEFNVNQGKLVNGLGENVEIPYDYLYPLYKSSHISRSRLESPSNYVLLTQKKIGDDTNCIKVISPETWNYLLMYAHILDKRKSSIYKNSPRFSVFGVGEYTFLPWKVVISGLYKNLQFSKIGSFNNKPIVVDDTCYLLGFEQEEQADFVLKLLSSELSIKFLDSIVFLDNKRPVTVSLLNRINFRQIARHLGQEEMFVELFKDSYAKNGTGNREQSCILN